MTDSSQDFVLWEKQMSSKKRGTVMARDAELKREALFREAYKEDEDAG